MDNNPRQKIPAKLIFVICFQTLFSILAIDLSKNTAKFALWFFHNSIRFKVNKVWLGVVVMTPLNCLKMAIGFFLYTPFLFANKADPSNFASGGFIFSRMPVFHISGAIDRKVRRNKCMPGRISKTITPIPVSIRY